MFSFLIGYPSSIGYAYGFEIISKNMIQYFPNIVAGIIFLLIGLYLMKKGAKEEKQRMPFDD